MTSFAGDGAHYDLLGASLRVRCQHVPLANALQWHLQPFEADESASCIVVEITDAGHGDLRYVRDGVEERRGPPRRILRHALWDIHRSAWHKRDDYLFVHAGAVVRDGAALLVVGEMEAGKSTLSARLLQMGWDYLSDELGVLATDVCAQPFPKHIALKPAALTFLPGLEQRLVDRDGLNAELPDRYARPQDLDARVATVSSVGKIALLSQDRKGPVRKGALSSAEAAVELGRHCFNFSSGPQILEKLVALVKGAEVYRIVGGNPKERAKLLND